MLRDVLRDHRERESPEVTSTELFFDLVYVFAITQLSHYLAEHLTARGAVNTLILFLAVWWAWNYTAWATNWVHPDRPPVRVMLLCLMALSLIMSAAIPEAFGGRGAAFAAAYVALQVLRSAFMVAAFGKQRMGRNYAQLLAWTCIAGVAWIAGAFLDADARLVVWIVALVLDLGAPMHGFALPVAGRTPMRDWTLAGGHLAERCQLVVLIALGESILAVGATFSSLSWSAAVVAAFVIGFGGTVSLWWLYFAREAETGARAMIDAADPARLGRAGYAYAHAIMVAGVIVVAVAIEKTMSHPTASTEAATAAVIAAGPGLYLAGNALFNFSVSGRVPLSRIAGVGALGVVGVLALVFEPLVLSALAALTTGAIAATAGTPRRASSAG